MTLQREEVPILDSEIISDAGEVLQLLFVHHAIARIGALEEVGQQFQTVGIVHPLILQDRETGANVILMRLFHATEEMLLAIRHTILGFGKGGEVLQCGLEPLRTIRIILLQTNHIGKQTEHIVIKKTIPKDWFKARTKQTNQAFITVYKRLFRLIMLKTKGERHILGLLSNHQVVIHQNQFGIGENNFPSFKRSVASQTIFIK